VRTPLIIALTAATALAGAVLPSGAGAATRAVGVCDNYFVRGPDCFNESRLLAPAKAFVIQKGDSVSWAFRGFNDHRVFAPKSSYGPGFDSGVRSSGAVPFKRRFRKGGTFLVYCTIHPTQQRMKVRVK